MQQIVLVTALFFASSTSMAGESFFADRSPQRHKVITQSERDNMLSQGYACNRADTQEARDRCRHEEAMAQQAIMKRIQANHQLAAQQMAEMRSLYRKNTEGR